MQALLPRGRMLIAYLSLYLAFAAAAARAIFELRDDPGIGGLLALLGAYLLILLAETPLMRRGPVFLHIANALQTGIAFALIILGDLDYFALLFIPPCAQSILNLPRRAALAWIIAINLLMAAALLAQFPLAQSVGYVIIYPTAIFLFTSLSYLAMRAQEAQSRGEALLADLQAANQKLQQYAAQVQELAAAQERNRLARELHDSVTQIIFGLTLSAQAARILLDRDPARAAAELDHLQALAQSALAEMRKLVQELHFHPAGDGLPNALRRLAAERQASGGLSVELRLEGDRRLPANVESELYRVAQEALNNVARHARASRASLTLDLRDPRRVVLCIEDDGVGFDPAQARALPGHLGLTSMEERVQALGGVLDIDSRPGGGARLTVQIPPQSEVEHAG